MHAEALTDAGAALAVDPKCTAALNAQGHAFFALEEFEAAKDAFEKLTVVDPAKRVHKQWANMCRVRLGEELPKEPDVLAGMLQPPPSSAPGSAAAPSTSGPTTVKADDAEYGKYWRKPAPSSTAEQASQPDHAAPAGSRYRHQWFQTVGKVEVAILAKGMRKDQVQVSIERRRLEVRISSVAGEVPGQEFTLAMMLGGEVDPDKSGWSVLGSKVEIVLAKAAPEQWASLEGEASAQGSSDAPIPIASGEEGKGQVTTSQGSLAYPYAGKKVDWDKIEAGVAAEEKEEQPDGDAGVMKFFRELYKDGDDDFRRAMMKSYVESGGVELSTNWDEVAKKDFKAASDNC